MPSLPILSTFTNFLHQSSPAPLQITFASLEIRHYQNGQFLNYLQRPQSSINLQKLPCNALAELRVVDNLVFSFSFQFRLPGVRQCHDMEMLSLPRPLDRGRLYLDEEKLQLSFRIDAPDPSLCVEVTHMYQGICHLEPRPVAANPEDI